MPFRPCVDFFFSKNQTKSQQKKGNISIVPPQKETFTAKLPVARKRKKKTTRSERQPNTPQSHPYISIYIARAALFRWMWVMVGGLCFRLTAGNVFCARSERKSPFFCLGSGLWLKFDIFLPNKVCTRFFLVYMV